MKEEGWVSGSGGGGQRTKGEGMALPIGLTEKGMAGVNFGSV